MTQTKAEQLAEAFENTNIIGIDQVVAELRRLSPMEMELAGTKAASIARQADLMGKNEALKARVKELEDVQDKACAIIINLWVQYGYTGDLDGSKDLPLEISHDFMSAGEEATYFLQANGCALGAGQYALITTKGLKLSEWDSHFLGYDEIEQNRRI
jgi:hypothetical protein